MALSTNYEPQITFNLTLTQIGTGVILHRLHCYTPSNFSFLKVYTLL